MKRTVKIRGFVSENGRLNMTHWEGKDLTDHSDLAMCAEDFDEDEQIQEISVEFELDVEAIFKQTRLRGKLSSSDEETR